MNRGNPKMDMFFAKAKQWRDEFTELRKIILGFDLNEDVKWRWPCYSLDGKNVVLIHGFKEHCDLLFFKGALLQDPKHILVTPGSTQAGRQMRFTNVREIVEMEPTVKAYIREAIEAEKSGLKVKMKKTSDFKVPEEFKKKLAEMPALKRAFAALTPGRQRGYLFYFSGAKQAKTREERVEKSVRQIMAGKGVGE
jgi:uncharacterized protein YdeI (YjbR/CyaY-like superfamily)